MNGADIVLEKLGLTPGERKVYLALLELGLSSSGPIVSKSGVSTSKVYKILDRLAKKGLVSFIKKEGVRTYKAEDPRQVLLLVEEKEKDLDSLKKSLNDIMPQLIAKTQEAEKKSTTLMYEGFNGLKSAFDQSLREIKKGDEILVLGITESTQEIRRYFIHYFKAQAKIGFKVKAIFDESARYKAGERKNKLTEFRYFQSGIITPATIVIYKDKTILTVGRPDYTLTIMMNNKDVAESFKAQFNMMWSLAKH